MFFAEIITKSYAFKLKRTVIETASIINTTLKKLTYKSVLPAYWDYTLKYLPIVLLTAINSFNLAPILELADIQL